MSNRGISMSALLAIGMLCPSLTFSETTASAPSSADLIVLPTPREEYLKDLTPTLRSANTIEPREEMTAAKFKKLGSLEKSLIDYNPNALIPMDRLDKLVCRSSLSRREYYLVKTVVSNINHCRYCLGGAVYGLRVITKDEKLIQSLLKNPKNAPLPPRERAMIEYAQALTQSPKDFKPVYVDNLRKAGWKDSEIFDLGLMTSWFNLLNRMGVGLGYALDPQRRIYEKQIFDKDYKP